jgi:hypothetical protein
MVAYNPANRVAEYAHEYAAESKELLEEYPIASVAIAFGLGMAAGIALVSCLADSSSHRHSSISHRLGAQLLEAMSSVVPESMARTLGAR